MTLALHLNRVILDLCYVWVFNIDLRVTFKSTIFTSISEHVCLVKRTKMVNDLGLNQITGLLSTENVSFIILFGRFHNVNTTVMIMMSCKYHATLYVNLTDNESIKVQKNKKQRLSGYKLTFL